MKDAQIQVPAREVYLLKRSTGKHGATLGKTTGWIHKASLVANNVQMISDVTYQKIDDDGLHIVVKGEARILPVDNVIICAGQEPSSALYQELLDEGLQPTLIGGADEAAELDAKRAIHQACHLASVL